MRAACAGRARPMQVVTRATGKAAQSAGAGGSACWPEMPNPVFRFRQATINAARNKARTGCWQWAAHCLGRCTQLPGWRLKLEGQLGGAPPAEACSAAVQGVHLRCGHLHVADAAPQPFWAGAESWELCCGCRRPQPDAGQHEPRDPWACCVQLPSLSGRATGRCAGPADSHEAGGGLEAGSSAVSAGARGSAPISISSLWALCACCLCKRVHTALAAIHRCF